MPSSFGRAIGTPLHADLQFHARVTGTGEGAWLPPGACTACNDTTYEVEEGEPIFVGVDVGGSRASTAVIGVTEDLRVAVCEVFQGDGAVLRVPDVLLQLADRYGVREVAYDPWRFKSEALPASWASSHATDGRGSGSSSSG
jgi:hypothetical protein